MQEIHVQYVDLSDPLRPVARTGTFLVAYPPTMNMMSEDTSGFTREGEPVLLTRLRLDEFPNDYLATTVIVLPRPVRPTYVDGNPMEGEPVRVEVPAPDASEFCDDFFYDPELDALRKAYEEASRIPPPPRPPNPFRVVREPEVVEECHWPLAECWNVLGINRQSLPADPVAALEIVKSKFRELAKLTHSDRGGSDATFKKVVEARDEAKVIFGCLIF